MKTIINSQESLSKQSSSSSSSSMLASTTIECKAPNAANNFQSEQLWALSSASVRVTLWDYRSLCTVLSHVTWRRPGRLFQPSVGSANRIILSSIVHLSYAPEDGEMTGLDGWSEKWLTGSLPNFCTGNTLAPLIEGVDFRCIFLGDCADVTLLSTVAT